MLFEMLWRVAVALFAAFGLYCAMRMLVEALFSSDRIAVAIEVETHGDAEELDMLLHEARVVFGRRRGTRLIVLLSSALMDGTLGTGTELTPACEELLDRYGAECYLMDYE